MVVNVPWSDTTIANTNTHITYVPTWADDGDDVLLRLTAGGAGSGNQDLTIVAGSNVSLTPSGTDMTIAATDTTYSVMDTNNSYAAGLVVGNAVHGGSFLRKDGTWQIPPDTTTNTQLDDAGVTGKVLTGLSVTETTADVAATDTILEAIGHMEKRIRLNDDKVTNTDTNTNQLTTFTLRGTSGTGHTAVGHGDTVTITAGTGITTTSTSDGVITIDNTVTNSNTIDMGDGFKIRDDDNDDIIITENEFIKFTAATGAAGTNLTGAGTTISPYVMAITLPNDNDDTIYTHITNANLTGDVTSVGNATTIAAGVIVDADVNASAAIAYSKLNLTDAVLNADLANDGITIGTADTSLGGTVTALVGLTDLDLTVGNKTIFDTVGANTLTMGASTTTIKVAGNLEVTGDTTYHNETIRITDNNKISFFATNTGGDDSSGDDGEVILEAQDPADSDVTITLPSATGTLALQNENTTGNADTATNLAGTTSATFVYAGPTTGTAAAPAFRALADTDIPTLNQDTSGSAGSLSATLAVGSGGTGVTANTSWLNSKITTTATGALNYDGTTAVAINHDSLVGFVAAEHYRWDTDISSTATINSANITTLNQDTSGNATTATTATHVAGGALGSIPYQTGSGATSLLAGNTVATKKFITQTGNGSISAAPAWGAVVAGDITSGTFADATITKTSVAQHFGISGNSATKYLKMTTDVSGVIDFTARSDSQMRSDLGLGDLATLDSVAAGQIDQNAVGNSELGLLAVSEGNMNISNSPTNDNVLIADSLATGGWKWGTVASVGGGIALTDLSVGAEGTPSGDGAVAYDNGTGVFTYTPAVNITGTAGIATTATVTANNTTNENNYLTFTAGATAAGDLGLETDTTLYYNPSQDKLFATYVQSTNLTATNLVSATAGILVSGNNGYVSLSGTNNFVKTDNLQNDTTLNINTTTTNSPIVIAAHSTSTTTGGDVTVGNQSGTGEVVVISPISKKSKGTTTVVETKHPATGSPLTSNASYAQLTGITKVQGSASTFGSVSSGSTFNCSVLPVGAVKNTTNSFRAIKGTIHIDAGLTSNNFVMTQDFIANSRDGVTFSFTSYGVVYEGQTDMPFEIAWSDVSSEDMPLEITNSTGAAITNNLKVWWDLTLFPEP